MALTQSTLHSLRALAAARPVRAICIAAAACVALGGCHDSSAPPRPGPAATDTPQQLAADIRLGHYLAIAADCAACHDAADHTPYAGGEPVNSPFGPIYAPNITPDPTYGIGRITLAQFDAALREGVGPDGSRLYPAMPYPSFARLSDHDVRALYAYFMHGVAPSAKATPKTRLPFPFDQRWALRFWSMFFANHKRYLPDASRSAEWNRGAYLVQGPGHCGACHTPRGVAYNERGYDESAPLFLSGGVNDHWFAPNLTGALRDGLGRWSVDDIAAFLRTGRSAHGAAFGSMEPVVTDSTTRLDVRDRHAIAVYLKSLPARPTATTPFNIGDERRTYAGPAPEGGQLAPGAGIYASFCARCHGANGEGVNNGEGESNGEGANGGGDRDHDHDGGPPLAGNSAVLAVDPTSVIRIVVDGNVPPPGGTERRMPAMRKRLTTSEIAAVISYVRGAWQNHAPPVSSREVARLRAAIHR